MKTVFIAFRALLSAIVFFWLWRWIALMFRPYDAQYGLNLPAWTQRLSVPVALLGCVLDFACVAAFVVHGRGTPAPIDPPREFVAVGPYRYVRNPMYIGGALILAGFALYMQSGAILLFCIPWLLFFHLFVVLYEEPTLRRKFNGPYDRYLKDVSRWLPRAPRANVNAAGGRA